MPTSQLHHKDSFVLQDHVQSDEKGRPRYYRAVNNLILIFKTLFCHKKKIEIKIIFTVCIPAAIKSIIAAFLSLISKVFSLNID